MFNHGRKKAQMAFWAAFAAMLCLPGSALAAHDLRLYKVEKQVTIESDGETESVSCVSSDDYALDGMWRIDHVDYDEDELYKDLIVSTDVLQAENDSADKSKYNFAFTKNAIGRVQLKVFITCLENATASDDSHTHGFTVSAQKTISATNVNNGDVTFGDHAGVENHPFAADQDTGTAGVQPCLPGEVVVSPGFSVTPNSGTEVADQFGRIITSTLANTTNRNSWKWAFRIANNSPTVDIKVSVRCLKLKVKTSVPVGTSKHKLIVKRNKDVTKAYAADKVSEQSLICGDHYKAVVTGWHLADPSYTWFLGMDPRLKSRAFRVFNSDVGDHDVALTALCFNYRTT
jgi:hypothetical protein